jgi:nitrate/TMAO reductase-like tetraheme cytochrome c subunit
MTQLPTPDTVVGNFNNVQLHDNDATYNLSRDSKNFWVQIDRPSNSNGASVESVTRPVVLTTGSHHMQVFWMPTGRGRELKILPFMYLVDEQRWIPRSAGLLQPPGNQSEPSGRWNKNCIQCHTTHGIPRPSPISYDSEVAEFGIACEACHGPGQQHVIKMNHRPGGSTDDLAIINPSKLSKMRASQICGQCHSVIYSRIGEHEDFLEHGFRFRPGDDLSKTRLHYSDPDNPYRFWSDGMARVSGIEYNGLSESACYKFGQMSCLSCHQMHQADDDFRPSSEWANDQLKLEATDNSTCVQCHQDYQDQKLLTAHTHHAPASSGSNCYNCHMPHTAYGLLKAIRSHQIAIPTVRVSRQTGRPMACNLCHLDKTLAWTDQHLEDWYGTVTTELTADERTIAASLLWALRGDAGQRALMVWHMGWKPAHEISGTDWIGPYLSQLLNDPYDAVRLITYRSLRRIPGYEKFQYDFVGPQSVRREAIVRAMNIWETRSAKARQENDRAVLIDAAGQIQMDTVRRLLLLRDDRNIGLIE